MSAAAVDAFLGEAPRNPVRWIVFAAAISATVIDMFDTTIVNVAGPSIRARSTWRGARVHPWPAAASCGSRAALV
jgi:hypothetical protein